MSTAFRDGIRKLAYKARAIPGKLSWRPYTVAIETRAWDGAERGQGTETVTTTAIAEADGQPPKVRWLTGEEIALGGYEQATIEIGPITPDFPGGGTTIDTLKPTPADNAVVAYVLTGPEFPSGARFRLRDVSTDRAGRYLVRVERAGDP